MKNREAINLFKFLTAFQDAGITLEIKEWKALSRNRKKLEEAVKAIDDARRELVKKFSSNDEDAEVIKVDEANFDAFEKEYIDLIEQTIDLELETISLANLGDKMNSVVGIWEFMDYMVSK